MKIIDNKTEFQAYIGDETIFENICQTGRFNTAFNIIPMESFSQEEAKNVLKILSSKKIKVTIEPIIEEVEDKEYKDIQKIKNKRFTRNQKQIASKINELIDAINEMRKVR